MMSLLVTDKNNIVINKNTHCSKNNAIATTKEQRICNLFWDEIKELVPYIEAKYKLKVNARLRKRVSKIIDEL